MFPSKTPALYLIQVVLTILAVIIALVLTSNPMCLFALMLIPSFPLVNGGEDGGEFEGGDQPGVGEASEYGSQSMGFLATLKN